MNGFRPYHRIRKSGEIQRALRQGTRLAGALFVVHAYRRPAGEPHPEVCRLGMAVSRRVGNAIVRNRVRRRLREIIRLNRSRLEPGWDFVVSARPDAATADYAMLEAEFIRQWKRAKVWRSES